MKRSSNGSNIAVVVLMLVVATEVAGAAEGPGAPNGHESSANIDAAPSEPPPSVLEESFRYHRVGELPEMAPLPSTAPVRGWYRYGFPAERHRWGWSGAKHYYPRVLWHRGYYGDRSRWSYRRGY